MKTALNLAVVKKRFIKFARSNKQIAKMIKLVSKCVKKTKNANEILAIAFNGLFKMTFGFPVASKKIIIDNTPIEQKIETLIDIISRMFVNFAELATKKITKK